MHAVWDAPPYLRPLPHTWQRTADKLVKKTVTAYGSGTFRIDAR